MNISQSHCDNIPLPAQCSMCPPSVTTTRDNARLSYSAIDNVLTNLLPAGLQDFFQMLNVSNSTTTVNTLSECSLKSSNPLGLSLGHSATNFLITEILVYEDGKRRLGTDWSRQLEIGIINTVK